MCSTYGVCGDMDTPLSESVHPVEFDSTWHNCVPTTVDSTTQIEEEEKQREGRHVTN